MKKLLTTSGVLMATALVATACSGGGDGGDGETVSVATSLTAADAPFIIGSDAGIWEDHGLNAENVAMQGFPPALAGLQNGSIQTVMQGPVAMAQANQEGADLRFFCGMGNTIWNGFLVAADGPLAGMADRPFAEKIEALRGKNIGVSALKSTTELLSTGMIEQVDMSAEDVTYVATGYGEGALQALKQGRVDAMLTYPFLTQQGGEDYELLVDLPNEDDAPADMVNTMGSGWMATKAWLDENPETAQTFCDAVGTSLEYVTDPANVEDVSGRIQEMFGIADNEVARSVVAPDGPLSLLETDLDCQALERAIALAEDQGQIRTEPKMTCDNMIWTAE